MNDSFVPNVTSLLPNNEANFTTTAGVNISANVTDNAEIYQVFANIV